MFPVRLINRECRLWIMIYGPISYLLIISVPRSLYGVVRSCMDLYSAVRSNQRRQYRRSWLRH